MRNETRRQRYDHKSKNAIKLPVSFVAINFDFDDNLAFLIRTAACFGMTNLFVIGSVPPRHLLNPKSGSLFDYVNLIKFSNPLEFLKFAREHEINLVSAELTEKAVSLYDYEFNFTKETAIVLGHETSGVPVEIVNNSDSVFVPMLGSGFCLNTSQTGTAFATEYVRQFLNERSCYKD